MRRLGIAAVLLLMAVLVGTHLASSSARAVLKLQEGTPEAATPEATAPPADVATAVPEATAAPEAPEAAAPTEVVTLVAWYGLSPSGEFLSIYPLQTDQGQLASQAGEPIGRADFPDDGLPTVILGDTTFQAYLRYEGDENNGQRWVWFDDSDGARPATLVIQVAGLDGTYRDYYGTATFVSRDEGNAGGILVLALRPPTPQAPAEAAPAEGTPAAGEEGA